jgi:hypothetical protein
MKRLLTLLLLCPLLANSQTTITLRHEQLRQISDIWSLSILNLNSSGHTAYIEGSIKERNAGEVYRAKGASFSLVPGNQVLAEQSILPLDVALNRLPEGDDLPNGRYWVQLSLYESDNGREIATVVIKVEVTDSAVMPDWKPASNTQNKLFSSNGRVRTVYNMALPGPVNSTIPPHVLRTDLQANVRMFSIPIQVNGLHTTENGRGIGPANQLGFRLDKAAVRAQAQQWLEQRLSAQELFDSSEMYRATMYRESLRDKYHPQYRDWRQRCDTLHLEEHLTEARQLDNIKTTLDNKKLTKQIHELEALKSTYGVASTDDLYNKASELPDSVTQRMQVLFRLEQSYRKLEQQRDELAQKQQDFKKYEGLYNKVKNIESKQGIMSLARDNDDLRQGMRMFGKLDRLQNILLGIDELDIGSAYPYFTPLTLNGMKIHGANVAYTTAKKWHISMNFGRKQQAQPPTDSILDFRRFSYYPQYLGGIQLGIGRPTGNFFYVHHIRSADYGGPLKRFEVQEDSRPLPQMENFVTGLAFHYQDPKQILTVSGEVNQSLYSPDKYAFVRTEETTTNLSALLGGQVKVGSALDWGYQGQAQIRLPNGNTEIKARYYHVGKGYQTEGAPFLLTDLTRYEVRASQNLLRSKMQIATYVRRDFDQTDPLAKINRTLTTNYGAQVKYNVSKSLSLSADYAPYSQQRDSIGTQHPINRKGQICMASMQYRKKLNASHLNLMSTWMTQQLVQDTSTTYQVHSVLSALQWQHNKYIFSINGQYSPRQYKDRYSTLYSLDGSATINRLFKKMNLTIGAVHTEEPNITTLTGVYLRSSAQLSRHVSLNANFRHAAVHRFTSNQHYFQDYGWLGVTMQW